MLLLVGFKDLFALRSVDEGLKFLIQRSLEERQAFVCPSWFISTCCGRELANDDERSDDHGSLRTADPADNYLLLVELVKYILNVAKQTNLLIRFVV